VKRNIGKKLCKQEKGILIKKLRECNARYSEGILAAQVVSDAETLEKQSAAVKQ
jgi:hypothetical protein